MTCRCTDDGSRRRLLFRLWEWWRFGRDERSFFMNGTLEVSPKSSCGLFQNRNRHHGAVVAEQISKRNRRKSVCQYGISNKPFDLNSGLKKSGHSGQPKTKQRD